MIDQMNIAVELKHPDEHEPIDLFFEAINLILPSSKISEHSRKIHRSNSVPNDLAGLSSPECRTDKVKLDPDTPNGIDFRPIVENLCAQVFTCLSKGCCQEFLNEADLANHFDREHKQCEISSKYVKSYKCEINKCGQMTECGRKLDSLNKMVSHILKEHTLQEQIAKKENNTLEFKFISRHLTNLIIVTSFYFKQNHVEFIQNYN
ncbi:hypothetical protein BpHYR1_048548 [Brachionus plicatilis]|uniref:C2H2-type domain-containing protein n=1 Tax=Brachionus plicatilis TaxID=10195 RepID=A0A3M7SJS9_BRAPC|nr:hypothetical protein BpHYR1_048548 [Brachionus plicatilis]